MNLLDFSAQRHKFTTWVLFLIFLSSISVTLSDPRITESRLFCGNSPSPLGTNMVPTFVSEMQSLSQLINDRLFATYQVDSNLSSIYALAQCHADLSQTDCLLCFAASRTRLPRCLPAVSGALFLDGCFLRYDNYSFYREPTSPRFNGFNCSDENATASVDFARNVGFAVANASDIAVNKNGFGVYGVNGVYALAQCWQSIGTDGCRECLATVAAMARSCVPKKEGRGMNAGCYLRYSTDKFYSNSQTEDSHRSSRIAVILAIAFAVAAFLTVLATAVYAAYARLLKIRQDRSNLGRYLSTNLHRSGLSFKYETLEKATDYFSPSRKIGQGGAGSVYVGTLPNGKTVAVKRLVFNTRQWVDEFFNEVNLISKIQHKNLVKLLGCSIEGPESLLVYEYVPNKSLDQFIFDETNIKFVNWKQRMNIIVGTAEGLAYLHGGSEVRIIHRDIKGSNVLLDEDLNPKIADFGLARCLAADKSHLSTGVAGTLGYMAPEYLVRGQVSEKVDVYGFGVLVLEIACGKRNTAFTKDFGSLLQMVWRHYQSGNLAEAIDPRITDYSSAKEASKVLQIGLLCAQASVALRPSMEQVVQMLTCNDYEIPIPSQPPFINASLTDSAGSMRSFDANSLILNAARKLQISSSSFESSSTGSSDGASRSESSMKK